MKDLTTAKSRDRALEFNVTLKPRVSVVECALVAGSRQSSRVITLPRDAFVFVQRSLPRLPNMNRYLGSENAEPQLRVDNWFVS